MGVYRLYALVTSDCTSITNSCLLQSFHAYLLHFYAKLWYAVCMLWYDVTVQHYDICMLYMSALLLWCDVVCYAKFANIFFFKNPCKCVITFMNVNNIWRQYIKRLKVIYLLSKKSNNWKFKLKYIVCVLMVFYLVLCKMRIRRFSMIL